MMNKKNTLVSIVLAGLMAASLTGCAGAAETTETKVPEKVQEQVVEETPVPVEEPATPELTAGQTSAIKKAEQYLAVTAFSRGGLIQQLEFEKFDTADAEFAVDYIDVDWNEQAVIKAELYLDLTGLSRDGLIQQLEFDKYTTEEATYAADTLGL